MIWPGKYDAQGSLVTPPQVRLPFQTIESVGESRASREARKRRAPSLFATWDQTEGDSFEEGWTNKLIWGDNLLVMQSLLDRFAGKIDLIYIDPPFAVGADFSLDVPVGDDRQTAYKEQSILEAKAYRDTWRRGVRSYISMMAARLRVMRDLLSSSGSIYVHCDWRVNSHLRLLMDEIFGTDRYRREVVWDISVLSGFKTKAKNWIRGHDTILYFTKGPQFVFHRARTRHRPEYLARFNKTDKSGRKYFDGRGKRRYLDDVVKKGKAVGDVWADIMSYQQAPTSNQRVGYDTEKPLALLRRVIESSSKEGGLVADFFCGSGTTMAVAEELGRRWIGCDLGRWAIHVTRKRLLDLERCRPFKILNLGKYERQQWQGASFSGGEGRGTEARYRYLTFILKLYGATPVAGVGGVHGRKGRAGVHVGAVDAPVTVDEIERALDECVAMKLMELHVLGWEWEMGVASGTDTGTGGLVHSLARQRKVRLRLLKIPREVMEQQAADAGDIRFFELAYLDAEILRQEGRWRRVRLTDFVVPNPEDVPPKVRALIRKWSDWVDYWAVDWDFRGDSFRHGFVTYRTRKDRRLELTSDRHQYAAPGKYRVVVKVVDIFGNDTSRAFKNTVA